MRANTRNAMSAWMQGKECRKADAVWTNGDHVYSYRTCMVAKASDGTVIVNATKYSVTTSCQQGGIRYYLVVNRIPFAEVIGVRIGASADDIRNAYETMADDDAIATAGGAGV